MTLFEYIAAYHGLHLTETELLDLAQACRDAHPELWRQSALSRIEVAPGTEEGEAFNVVLHYNTQVVLLASVTEEREDKDAIRRAIADLALEPEHISAAGAWQEGDPKRPGRYLIEYEQYGQRRVFVADFDAVQGWLSLPEGMAVLRHANIRHGGGEA